jgi:hypothetical protein
MPTTCGALTATATFAPCRLPVRPGFHTCEEHALQDEAALALFGATVTLAAARDHLKGMARAALEAKLRADGLRWILNEEGRVIVVNGTEEEIKRAFDVKEIREYGGDAYLRYGVHCYDALKKYNVLFVDTTPEAALMFAREECGLAAHQAGATT